MALLLGPGVSAAAGNDRYRSWRSAVTGGHQTGQA